MKSWGPGISPDDYECAPAPPDRKLEETIEPKEIPRCLIPHLLVVLPGNSKSW